MKNIGYSTISSITISRQAQTVVITVFFLPPLVGGNEEGDFISSQ